ncbi:MAG: M48 family metallopeptidase [Fimbriimonadales bacterium]|nr:M48 family metallopeptidase [Fimbriimonadales bacterium]
MSRWCAGALAAALLFGAWAPARADLFRPSREDQVKLGQRAAEQVRKKEKVLPGDDPHVVLLRRLADRILRQLPEKDRSPWRFSFDVIESKEINAFALPGGPVFFYTGLLRKLSTEDQVAAVLAHEITHATHQHWASAYADNQKRRLGLVAVLALLRANRAAFDVASVADDLLFTLPYSRRHETEADMVGYDLMTAAGFNPQGMVEVFDLLRRATAGGKPPEFLSTHPDDAARIRRIQDRIARDRRSFPAQTPLPWQPEELKPKSAK